MSSPCLGISNFLQNSSIRCFGAHPMKKVFHRKETKVCPRTQSLDMDKRGNQDAIPAEYVVSRR